MKNYFKAPRVTALWYYIHEFHPHTATAGRAQERSSALTFEHAGSARIHQNTPVMDQNAVSQLLRNPAPMLPKGDGPHCQSRPSATSRSHCPQCVSSPWHHEKFSCFSREMPNAPPRRPFAAPIQDPITQMPPEGSKTPGATTNYCLTSHNNKTATNRSRKSRSEISPFNPILTP